MTIRRTSRLILCLALLILLAAGRLETFAENAPASSYPTSKELSEAITFHYKKPADVVAVLHAYERLDIRPEPMMGFLAGLFVRNPAVINIIAKTPLQRKGQAIVIQALRLADKTPQALVLAKEWQWPPEQIVPIKPVVPLLRIRAESPMTFDTLWAASFATGNPQYVRPIFSYYAEVASEVDVFDVVKIVTLRHRVNKEPLDFLKQKYPEKTLMRVVIASSALWSLESNGRQHQFVAEALKAYEKEQPNSPAIKGLRELRQQMQAFQAKGSREKAWPKQ